MTATLDDEVAELRRANAELQRKLDEALAERDDAEAQKAAMAEVLEVINSSPGELVPVFDAILDKALTLCGAADGHVFLIEGETSRPIAARGSPDFVEWILQLQPSRPSEGGVVDRLMRGERVVHILDAVQGHGYRTSAAIREIIVRSGVRTGLGIALRKDNALLAAILVNRREVRPFTEKQIALLQNFAAQAVIAMENARLITETREALDQQTATAEVLGVINSSPGDLRPVFDAILEKAHTLCRASFGGLMAIEGDQYRAVAVRGPAELADYWRSLGWIQFPTGPNSLFTILSRGELIHVADAANDHSRETSESYRRLVELGHARTLLMVPLRKDETLLGAITAFRDEVRLFSDKEVALLQNFAAQAVIAIENARLITETREALEQQTATAEVLGVINASPGDLVPVFDAMLEKAMHLCEASFGELHTYDGERFHTAAIRGASTAYVEARRKIPPTSRVGTGAARILETKRGVHILDLKEGDGYKAGDGGSRTLGKR